MPPAMLSVRTHCPNVSIVRLLEVGKTLSLRTELVANSVPPAWLRRNGHLVDRVTLPLQSREDWLDLTASVAVVRAEGVELGLETTVPRGRGRASLGFSRLIGALQPISWKVTLESPEDLEAFIIRNSMALDAVPEVFVDVRRCLLYTSPSPRDS